MSIAVMIMPGVQKPHCSPWCSRNASCIGCSGAPSAASPSIVLTSCPSAMTMSVVHDFTALPSRCTTQAPHCDVSQPTWVPVSRRFSRRNCTSRVRGSTLAVTGLPFTIKETLAIRTLYLVCVAADDLRTRISAALGELAADLGLDVIGEQRAAVLVGEFDGRAALGEAGDAALALARNLVAI